MSNIDDQVSDIRERVARIEMQVSCLQGTLDSQGRSGNGNVVLPVAAVITILEIVKAVIERLS